MEPPWEHVVVLPIQVDPCTACNALIHGKTYVLNRKLCCSNTLVVMKIVLLKLV